MPRLNFEFTEPSDIQAAIAAMTPDEKDALLAELMHHVAALKTVNGAFTAALDKVFKGRRRRSVIIDFSTPEFPSFTQK